MSRAGEASVDACDSFELWHHVTCRNYSSSEFLRCSESTFNTRTSMRSFGALSLSELSSGTAAGQLIRGSSEAIAMIREGQLRNINGSDIRAQAQFIAGLFQVAA